VMAIKDGAPPLSKNTRTGGDGAFEIQGLPAGKYSVCVQAGDGYLDPCQWNETPATVTLVSGQAAKGMSVRLTAASILTVEVQDAQKVLSQKTKDGRRPGLMVGVWGPKGLYYPARATGGPVAGASSEAAVDSYRYQIAVPRDMMLKLQIASRDLKLGDGTGVALPGNASQQAFQHAAGDPNPKTFVFTVLGLLP